MNKINKVVVIGLDGATWDLIKPWAKEGKLPTFKKLMEQGAWGKLESTMPPVTAPAWASFITGRNPGKTGVYDFLYLKEKFPPKVGVCCGAMVKENNLLTILSDQEFKVVSINIPMTYPPYEVNGSLITGIETPDGGKFAYPDGLYEELLGKGYFPEPKLSYRPGAEEGYLSGLYSMIESRNKILFDFLEDDDFDLLLFLFRETDLISHTFWKYMDDNHPLYPGNNFFGESMLEIYEEADKLLKEVLVRKDKNTLLIVMSDHGFGPEYYRVNLNNWLLRKGYISLKSDLRTTTKKLVNEFISPSRAWDMANKLGLKWLGEKKKMQIRTGQRGLFSKCFLSFDDVDWKQTEAYSIGCIGRHLPIFVKDRKSVILEEIKKDILSINEHLDREVVGRIIDARDVYTKNSVNVLPDLFVEFREPYAGYVLPPPYISEANSVVCKSPVTQSGAHKTIGILMAIGPEVRSGEISKSSITDIAPTLLALFGSDSPKEMDGRILHEIFEKEGRNQSRLTSNKSHQKMLRGHKRTGR